VYLGLLCGYTDKRGIVRRPPDDPAELFRTDVLAQEVSVVENLVLCPCGHSLTQHDYGGCAGERLRHCPCPYDRHAALEAAVDTARLSPAYASGPFGNATRRRAHDAA
jgi:hypothetical protein